MLDLELADLIVSERHGTNYHIEIHLVVAYLICEQSFKTILNSQYCMAFILCEPDGSTASGIHPTGRRANVHQAQSETLG